MVAPYFKIGAEIWTRAILIAANTTARRNGIMKSLLYAKNFVRNPRLKVLGYFFGQSIRRVSM